MRAQQFPENAVAALEKIYGVQKGEVKQQQKKPFDIGRGVRQGDPLSARIFGMIVAKLFGKLAEKWKAKGWGVFLADELLTHGCYADDAFVMANSRRQLAAMMKEVVTAAAELGLKLNWSKTKAMDMQGAAQRPILFQAVGEECKLDFVHDFVFLGRHFEKGGGGNGALQRRVQKAWAAFWANKDVLLDKTLPLRRRLAYLSQTVGAVVLYAAESLELSKEQLTTIRTQRRQMMRRMSGRRWEGDRREEQADEYGDYVGLFPEDPADVTYANWISALTKELEEKVEEGGAGTKWEEEAVKRKWAWTGHQLRRNPARRTTSVVAAAFEGVRRVRRGTPTTRWADTFCRTLGDNWQVIALERAEWRFWGGEAAILQAIIA
jgi:hypothetical protein